MAIRLFRYLEEFLSPLGTVRRQYEVPGEPKFIDVWFVPDPETVAIEDLGLLGQMVQKPCILNPIAMCQAALKFEFQ